MPNARMIISKERWAEMSEKEQSWILYDTMISVDERMCCMEKQKTLTKALTFLSGVVGGASAYLGIKLLH